MSVLGDAALAGLAQVNAANRINACWTAGAASSGAMRFEVPPAPRGGILDELQTKWSDSVGSS